MSCQRPATPAAYFRRAAYISRGLAFYWDPEGAPLPLAEKPCHHARRRSRAPEPGTRPKTSPDASQIANTLKRLNISIGVARLQTFFAAT